MSEIWHISDHHLGHANLLNWQRADGSPKRDFATLGQMHAYMVERHNSVVTPNDKVYFHGDVASDVETLMQVIPQLNGQKRLILGNHDNFDIGVYQKHFRIEAGWRQFGYRDLGCALVCTHFPLHPGSFLHRYEGVCINVHGHTHENHVRIHGTQMPDPRYFNVSVEAVDYTPVNHEHLVRMAERLRGRRAAA